MDAGSSDNFIEERFENDPSLRSLSDPDRRLVQELVYGSIRLRNLLDEWIRSRTDRRDQIHLVQNALRIGLYQILCLDRVPPHAAVNETVEALRSLGGGHCTGFVNAVLRSHVRTRETVLKEWATWRQSFPARAWSHPDWLVNRWFALWPDTTASSIADSRVRSLLEWNNTPPKVFARLNRLKMSLDMLLDHWTREGVLFEPVDGCDWLGDHPMFSVRFPGSPTALPSFQSGGFYIQDPSTVLAPAWLNPQPGERVLDACAAPGGKTLVLAEQMQNTGTLLALDVTQDRLARLHENLDRAGVTCCEVRQISDADPEPGPGAVVGAVTLDVESGFEGSFDKILVDAPCSNTGVLRRRVELRWRLRDEEFERLANLQLRLLDRWSRQLRPGGDLVYSTCSIDPEENECVVEGFLKAHPEYELVRQRTLLPFREAVDGAFVALLRRSAQG